LHSLKIHNFKSEKQRLTTKKNRLYEDRTVLENKNAEFLDDMKDLDLKLKEIQ